MHRGDMKHLLTLVLRQAISRCFHHTSSPFGIRLILELIMPNLSYIKASNLLVPSLHTLVFLICMLRICTVKRLYCYNHFFTYLAKSKSSCIK